MRSHLGKEPSHLGSKQYFTPPHIVRSDSDRTPDSSGLSADFAIFGNWNNFCQIFRSESGGLRTKLPLPVRVWVRVRFRVRFRRLGRYIYITVSKFGLISEFHPESVESPSDFSDGLSAGLLGIFFFFVQCDIPSFSAIFRLRSPADNVGDCKDLAASINSRWWR